MKRDAIDFHEVRSAHGAIHERLLNWARWCKGGGGRAAIQPMFQGYRPDGYHEVTAGIPIDTLDGHAMERMVIALPDKHRAVLQWWYVRPYIPVRKVRQALGLTFDEVHGLVHDARAMLKNRSL